MILLLPTLDIHVLKVHLYVYRVTQLNNHFPGGYVPLLSMHKQFDQLAEMENNINLDEVDDEMFVCPDQVVC
jgi:hypothetical protein